MKQNSSLALCLEIVSFENRYPNPLHCRHAYYHYAIRALNTMCQSAVFKSNQCKKRNPVQLRFDVRNRDGAVDTTGTLLKTLQFF